MIGAIYLRCIVADCSCVTNVRVKVASWASPDKGVEGRADSGRVRNQESPARRALDR